MRNLILAGLLVPALLTAACSSGPGAAERQAQAVAEQSRAAEQARLAEEARLAEQARLVEAARLRGNVETVLAADAQTDSAGGVAARVAAMRAIDLSGCPPEFSAAYVDHIYAWEKAAKVRAAIAALNSDDSMSTTLVASLVSAAFDLGETPIVDHIHTAKRLADLNSEADDEIRSTFHQVERLAVGYGAALPQPRA